MHTYRMLPMALFALLFALAAGQSAEAARLLHVTVGVARPDEDETIYFQGIATDNGRQQGADLLGVLKDTSLEPSKQELAKRRGVGVTIAEHGFVRIMHTDRVLITVNAGKLRVIHDADKDSWQIDPHDVQRIIRDYEAAARQ